MQTSNEEKVLTFKELGLSNDLLRSINDAGFSAPSPIQAQAIPFILQGRDIVGQAHTGTGKTAAFSLPALDLMDDSKRAQILVITPTRELATQVSDEIYKYGKYLGIKTSTVYGGSSYSRQIDNIRRGVAAVVATPGRLLDLLKGGKLENFEPKIVVLDEADEMLDMGFLDDINEIFSYLPSERQTLLFSATMPQPIKNLANRILQNPEFISITKGETTNSDIEQLYYVIEDSERDDAIIRLLDAEETQKSVVFCRTKSEVDRLSNVLSNAGYLANGLHGDMEQKQREIVIKGFKSNNVKVLVATDVAARGIHVNNISHVFNYHIPFDPESYVHRIGRTGRAGTKGKAITLLTPLEFKELQKIKSIVKTNMEHAYIPSKHDLKQNSILALSKAVKEQHIYDEAHKLLDILREELDEEQMAYKLISMLLDKQEIKGPNEIGIPAERLTKILDRQNNRREGGRDSRGGRGGNFRNGRSRQRQDNHRSSRDGGYDRNRGERSSGDRNRSDRGASHSRSPFRD